MLVKRIDGILKDEIGGQLARSNWFETLGIDTVFQINEEDNNGIPITLFVVKNLEVWEAANIENVVTQEYNSVSDANVLIESFNYDVYKKENEGLMNANLTQLANDNVIVFSDMSTDMTEQEELAYLYSKGCSGISKNRKYTLLDE